MKPEGDTSQMNKRAGDFTWPLVTQQALFDFLLCPLFAGDTQQTTTGMKWRGLGPPWAQTDGTALGMFLNLSGLQFPRWNKEETGFQF